MCVCVCCCCSLSLSLFLFRDVCAFSNTDLLNMCADCFVEQHRRSDASMVRISTISRQVEVQQEIRLGEEIITTEVEIVEIEMPADPEPTSRRQQKNRSRCFHCRKRTGILGFQCRCEYTFCTLHRLPEAHACDFDHRTFGRQLLQDANPVVKASKVTRI